ncbi:uncharacterized protein LOC128983258 [Macrosteles quadrilineatus]|uniref:uncharacterized protein LOC128983258 n=1 Tax=Macrosteles quadrilineatus TaxID=74068 RepID=UPI0023E2C9C8|nr:uncharacterized protein LOC128983258 [Macrosteles quadrilineatus]
MSVARTTLVLVCCLVAVRADGLGVFSRVLDKCGDEPDLYSCLRLKTVALLDRALTVDTLPVTDYLTITRDPAVDNATPRQPVRTEGELEASLPRDQHKRSAALDQMLQDRVSRYLDTRTIQISMPAHVLEAGRKKKDKGGMMMMAAAAMGGMMLQMAMGKIALIAGKALLIGKVALLLSAIVGLKKLVGSGGGESHPQVVYAGGDHHGGWGRSLEAASTEAAQDVVYQAYRPQS